MLLKAAAVIDVTKAYGERAALAEPRHIFIVIMNK